MSALLISLGMLLINIVGQAGLPLIVNYVGKLLEKSKADQETLKAWAVLSAYALKTPNVSAKIRDDLRDQRVRLGVENA